MKCCGRPLVCHSGLTCAGVTKEVSHAAWARSGRPLVCRHVVGTFERDLPGGQAFIR
jgi:hypothetical protein